mgnify:CR=1 FL=1
MNEMQRQEVKQIVKEVLSEMAGNEKSIMAQDKSVDCSAVTDVDGSLKKNAANIVKAEESGLKPYGKKSKYYGLQIDGYVWDPYIDARWLPSQYIGWMKRYSENTMKAIRAEVPYMKSVRFTAETVRKMVLLYKRDKEAFGIEVHFFGLSVCKEILLDYADTVEAYLRDYTDKFIEKHNVGSKVVFKNILLGSVSEEIENHKVVKVLDSSSELNLIMEKIREFRNDVAKCMSFEELDKEIQSFKFLTIPASFDRKKIPEFVHAFQKRGAWKTLAYLVRFEGYGIRNREEKVLYGKEAYTYLLGALKSDMYPGYVYHAVLKKALHENGCLL